MQLIAVDIGNSSTKIAVDQTCDDDRRSSIKILRGSEQPDENWLRDIEEPCFWSVSSVNKERLESLNNWVCSNRPADMFHPISADDVEMETNVESREQLGRDRLIAAWMAVQLDDQSGPLVVVDAGTAVTIDYVDADEVFQGGVIYPGAESNFRHLAAHTDALPNLSQRNTERPTPGDVIGKSTRDAILKGVFHSQACAILGIVKRIQSQAGQPTPVYITGGGIANLIDFFPAKWNEVPDLVLRGSKEIGLKLVSSES
jgi:type III pantothenate kinase